MLAIGDVVGEGGVEWIKKNLWRVRSEYKVDFAVANGENCAKGNGIDAASAKAMLDGGVDVITTGNHVWRQRDIYPFLDECPYILRPANFPPECPGRGYAVVKLGGYKILFVNLMGSMYMEPGLACPFMTAQSIVERERGSFDFAAADFHAEATSEKAAMGAYLDGMAATLAPARFAAVFGTHTHVQTSDARVLANGAGFITDLGMTGPRDSVIGVNTEAALKKFITKMPVQFKTSDNPVVFEGALFRIVLPEFKSVAVEAVRI